MEDKQLTFISSRYADEFLIKVNKLLSEGSWRVMAVDISVSDDHHVAVLVQSNVIVSNEKAHD